MRLSNWVQRIPCRCRSATEIAGEQPDAAAEVVMAQLTRPYPIALDRLAGLNIVVLVLLFAVEILVVFVVTPSKAFLAFAAPVCHYGIIASLLTAVVLVLLSRVFAVASRQRAK